MRIRSISVQGMWSFDRNGIQIDELSDHNIFIGKNNSGKSNILRSLLFLQDNHKALGVPARFKVAEIDRYEKGKGGLGGSPQVLVDVFPEPSDMPTIMNQAATPLENAAERDLLTEVLKSGVRFGFVEVDSSTNTIEPRFNFIAAPSGADFNEVATPGRDQSKLMESWKTVTRHAQAACLSLFNDQLRYASGWRQLRGETDRREQIIGFLHRSKAPDRANTQLKEQFDRVEDLFRELMRTPSLELVPEHTGHHLHIDWNGRYLPIESFGDGVQHLLMIAFYLATQPEANLLIEEPETHLHPESLRTLMAVIKRELKGQSFITTHSPVLLDTKIASQVYRIEHDGMKSSALRCKGLSDYYGILDDLGVRPSDLLQSNVVIWVEGPTDRMFLKKCLALRNSQWSEGLHYLIAFYGGALLSHLTAGEDADQLVDLLRLCRNVVVVCDSDKEKEEDTLSLAKERVCQEVVSTGGLCWITAGREIENYFPDSVLARTYQRLLELEDVQIQLGKFGRLEKAIREHLDEPAQGKKWTWWYDRNKRRLMREILADLRSEELDRFDLKDRLDDLELFIATANPDFRPALDDL